MCLCFILCISDLVWCYTVTFCFHLLCHYFRDSALLCEKKQNYDSLESSAVQTRLPLSSTKHCYIDPIVNIVLIPVALERIWKWGRHIWCEAPKSFFVVQPYLFGSKSTILVVSVSAFMMVNTVWSVSCLLFFYSRCPPPVLSHL